MLTTDRAETDMSGDNDVDTTSLLIRQALNTPPPPPPPFWKKTTWISFSYQCRTQRALSMSCFLCQQLYCGYILYFTMMQFLWMPPQDKYNSKKWHTGNVVECPCMAPAWGKSNRNAMKLKIGQHDGEWSKAKCNLQVSRLPFITQRGSREFTGKKKKMKYALRHSSLFVIFHPPALPPVRLSGTPAQTPLPPFSGSPCCVLTRPHFVSSCCQNFSNTTKLVGISSLSVSHRNIL